MKKILNIALDYLLPILLVLTSTIAFVNEPEKGTREYFSLAASLLFASFAVWLSLREKWENASKTSYQIDGSINISKEKDNAKLGQTLPLERDGIAEEVNHLVSVCYKASYNGGWHTDKDGNLLDRNKAEMLCLIHSEISEAMEGERKGLMDDHLPHRPAAEVELADAVIRIADYCGRWGYNLGGAINEKLEYNSRRADHKRENREKEGGKKF